MEEGVYAYNEINCYHGDFADKVRIILGGDYEIKVEEGNTYIVRKKPQYPKTYKECAKELGYNQVMPTDHILGYKGTLLSCFQQLLICRDAYWEIAGEELGLGKPWEPDWKSEEDKHCISTDEGDIRSYSYVHLQLTLAFPTAEMRDAFLENFKERIEICKELL